MNVKSKAVAAKDYFHGGKIVVATLMLFVVWLSGYFGIPRMPDAGDVAPAVAIVTSLIVIGAFVGLVWAVNTRGPLGRNIALAVFGVLLIAVTILVTANWAAVAAAFTGFSILDTLVWGGAIVFTVSYVGFVSYKGAQKVRRVRRPQPEAEAVVTVPPSTGAVV